MGVGRGVKVMERFLLGDEYYFSFAFVSMVRMGE